MFVRETVNPVNPEVRIRIPGHFGSENQSSRGQVHLALAEECAVRVLSTLTKCHIHQIKQIFYFKCTGSLNVRLRFHFWNSAYLVIAIAVVVNYIYVNGSRLTTALQELQHNRLRRLPILNK